MQRRFDGRFEWVHNDIVGHSPACHAFRISLQGHPRECQLSQLRLWEY